MSKLIFNHLIPPKGFKAITLFPFIFVRNSARQRFTYQDLNHEQVHIEQEKEMLVLPFLLWYLVEWLIRLILYKGNRKEAYRNISFEQEAYLHQGDMDYLKTRRRYVSWLRYILTKHFDKGAWKP